MAQTAVIDPGIRPNLNGLRRRFSDYPTKEWIDAVGKCGSPDMNDEYAPDCNDEHVKIRITNPGNENAGWLDIKCGVGHSHSDYVGWTLGPTKVKIGGLGTFYPILGRSNHGYCALCGRIIADIPITFYAQKGGWMLDFCTPCAEKHGVVKFLLEARRK